MRRPNPRGVVSLGSYKEKNVSYDIILMVTHTVREGDLISRYFQIDVS